MADLRQLTIDDEVKTQIAELRARAEASPTPLDVMKKRTELFQRGEWIPTTNLEMTIPIPDGFLVTFETEEHPICACRHISVSVNSEKTAPPDALVAIMREFGFINVLQECVVYILPCEDGPPAIHVIEPLDGNMQRLLAVGSAPRAVNDE